MIVKVLLITAVIGFGIFTAKGSSAAGGLALRRIAGLLFAGAAILSVLFPNAVTWAAHAVGVGRGSDLVLYGTVISFLFTAVGLYQRIQRLEARVLHLTRELALHTATSTGPTPGPTATTEHQSAGA